MSSHGDEIPFTASIRYAAREEHSADAEPPHAQAVDISGTRTSRVVVGRVFDGPSSSSASENCKEAEVDRDPHGTLLVHPSYVRRVSPRLMVIGCDRLLQFPETLVRYFNSGSEPKMLQLVESLCTVDCVHNLIHTTEIGQRRIYEFFVALLKAHPDALYSCRESQFMTDCDGNDVVTATLFFSGTLTFREFMAPYCGGTCPLTDMMSAEGVSTSQMESLKSYETSLHNKNAFVKLYWRDNLRLVIDPHTQRFHTIEHQMRLLSFTEYTSSI